MRAPMLQKGVSVLTSFICIWLVSHTLTIHPMYSPSKIYVLVDDTQIPVDTPPIPVATTKCILPALMANPDALRNAIRWNVSATNVSLSITNCSLEWTAEEAKVCLASACPDGLMLMGDSLTRYQYLNLVHFLATGMWHSQRELPMENEHLYRDWTHFYQETNRRLGGFEICDCHRGEGTLENRYFSDPVHAVRVVYMQVFADHVYPPRMHRLEQLTTSCVLRPNSTGVLLHQPCVQSLCAPGDCKPTPGPSLIEWPNGISHALADMALTVRPSDILFNAGLWYKRGAENSFVDGDRLDRFAAQVNKTRQGGSRARFHWKTTTATRGATNAQTEYAFARNLETVSGFDGVYDAYALTDTLIATANRQGVPLDTLTWDDAHFHTATYVALNQALLTQLCPKDAEST